MAGYRERLAREDAADEAAAEDSAAGAPTAARSGRQAAMRAVNPRVVLRNWIAQVFSSQRLSRRGPEPMGMARACPVSMSMLMCACAT